MTNVTRPTALGLLQPLRGGSGLPPSAAPLPGSLTERNWEAGLPENILLAVGVLEIAGPPEVALFTGAKTELVEEGVGKLTALGLLDWIWLPLEPSHTGRWVTALTRKGARQASEILGQRIKRLRADDTASIFLHHRLAVSQVVAALVAGMGHSRIRGVHVGRRLESTLKEAGARSRYRPDAYIGFSLPQGSHEFVRHLFLEVDRSTERSGQLQRKLRLLDEYYLGDHRRVFASDRLLVAFTVATTQRYELIRALVREGHCRVRVVAAQHSAAVDRDHAIACWCDCRTDEHRSLLDPAGSGIAGE